MLDRPPTRWRRSSKSTQNILPTLWSGRYQRVAALSIANKLTRHARGVRVDFRKRRLLNIHNDVAELKEFLRRHRLCEEISCIGIGTHERHDDFSRLNHVAYVEMAPLDMFGPLMKFGIVGEIMSSFILTQSHWEANRGESEHHAWVGGWTPGAPLRECFKCAMAELTKRQRMRAQAPPHATSSPLSEHLRRAGFQLLLGPGTSGLDVTFLFSFFNTRASRPSSMRGAPTPHPPSPLRAH